MTIGELAFPRSPTRKPYAKHPDYAGNPGQAPSNVPSAKGGKPPGGVSRI